ncbi:MAG: PAS domain S-box protein [Nitrospirota bacterium]|nr:PAS domain S-box protein [Nitrospirota bacterium]
MNDNKKTKTQLIAELRALRRAYSKLEKSESKRRWIDKNLSRRFLDLKGVIVVAINAAQKVSFINRTGCTMLGCNKKEVLGKNWFETFIPEDIRSELRVVFEKLMEGEVELTEYFDNMVLTKKGEIKIFAWHNTVLTDNYGKITGTLSWGEDITERKKAESEAEKLVQELRDSLTELKSLKVQMPICSWDKKNLQEAIRQHYDNVSKEGKCAECLNTLLKFSKK